MAEKRKAEKNGSSLIAASLPNPKLLKSAPKSCPLDELRKNGARLGCDLMDEGFAKKMDELDPLAHLRNEFVYPKNKELPPIDLSLVDGEEECIYLCGNSLGLLPKGLKHYLDAELEKWGQTGVHGHFGGQLPWAHCDEVLRRDMATIVGAEEEEVAIMNGLTVNLHLLMLSFYQPTPSRHKILIEAKAFPSDHYAMESQIRLKGFDPATSLVCLEPREGEHNLRTEDIVRALEEQGEGVALVLLGALQYYTGQLFDMQTITKAGHAQGCMVGFDLAHAVGNVEISLHDWDVDFAVWCTYKYLNSGAGSLGGGFLHSKHKHTIKPQLVGWWGHEMKTRFQMTNKLDLSPGIDGYRLTNPSIFATCPIRASLDVFGKTSMSALRAKSMLLTGYLDHLVGLFFGRASPQRTTRESIDILTPSDPTQRGAQLSLSFSMSITRIHQEMEKRGIVCDERKPNVIRIAPAPLYNSFHDVWRFVQALQDIMLLVGGPLEANPGQA